MFFAWLSNFADASNFCLVQVIFLCALVHLYQKNNSYSSPVFFFSLTQFLIDLWKKLSENLKRSLVKQRRVCDMLFWTVYAVEEPHPWPLTSHMTSMITQKRTVILCRLHTNMKFMELFGRLNSVVIGMIHVKALPGNVHSFTHSFIRSVIKVSVLFCCLFSLSVIKTDFNRVYFCFKPMTHHFWTFCLCRFSSESNENLTDHRAGVPGGGGLSWCRHCKCQHFCPCVSGVGWSSPPLISFYFRTVWWWRTCMTSRTPSQWDLRCTRAWRLCAQQ